MLNVRTSVKTVTPACAARLMIHNKMNRPLNRITVEDYKAQMLKGRWQLNGEPIIISDDGTLLDGQHRLTAVMESGCTVQMVIVEGVPQENFVTIDTGRTRTAADVFNIEDINNATSLAAIITAYFRLIKQDGSSTSKDNLRRLRLSKAELLEFYKKNSILLQDIYKFASKCHNKLSLMRTTEIGSLYLYLHKELNHPEEKIESFFNELVGILPVTNNTIQLLRDSYLKNLLGKLALTSSQKKAYLIKTWNSYVKGKELKVLNYNKEKEGFIHFV